MSANLLELSKNVLSPGLITKIAEFTGEDPDCIKTSIDLTLPAIVGSFTGKISNEKGASEIMKLIRDGGYDGNILKNPENSFSDNNKFKSVIDNASGSTGFLFKNKIKDLTNLISNKNGISQSSAASLTGILTAVVMSITGKQLLTDNLNSRSLASLLAEQKTFLTGQVNSDVAGILKLGSFDNTNAPLDQFNEFKDTGNSSGKEKFKPWLFIAICAALLFILWRSCGVDKPPAIKKSENVKTDSLSN